jgi:DNA-binding transcriptional regulator LsrR (DeoR family)
MSDWWTELDAEILDRLLRVGVATPTEVAEQLGISEASAVSLLSMLVAEGKVRIRLVERAGDRLVAEAPGPNQAASQADVVR